MGHNITMVKNDDRSGAVGTHADIGSKIGFLVFERTTKL